MRALVLCLVLTVHLYASADDYILAVNEGVTYQDQGPISERYKPFLELLEKVLKHTVKVKSVDRYSDFEKGLSEQRYDLAFIHPAHIGLRAVKSGQYFGVASAKDYTDYHTRLLIPKDSPLKSVRDLAGKKIGVPALESITTVMLTANLRDLGFDRPEDMYLPTRYQDAVPFMVENKFVAAGATGSGAVAKAWVAKGGKILAETPSVPIKQFLASSRLDTKQREKLAELLLQLQDDPKGVEALKGLNLKGFVAWNEDQMREATKRLKL